AKGEADGVGNERFWDHRVAHALIAHVRDDADDLEGGIDGRRRTQLRQEFQVYRMSDGVPLREISIRHRLIDDRDLSRVQHGRIRQQPAAQQPHAQRVEVAIADQLDAAELLLVRPLSRHFDLDTRAEWRYAAHDRRGDNARDRLHARHYLLQQPAG